MNFYDVVEKYNLPTIEEITEKIQPWAKSSIVDINLDIHNENLTKPEIEIYLSVVKNIARNLLPTSIIQFKCEKFGIEIISDLDVAYKQGKKVL